MAVCCPARLLLVHAEIASSIYLSWSAHRRLNETYLDSSEAHAVAQLQRELQKESKELQVQEAKKVRNEFLVGFLLSARSMHGSGFLKRVMMRIQ